MQQEIRAYLRDGYFAQGVALLRRCAGVAPARLRHFEAQLGKHYVPTSVENELAVLLRGFLSEEQPPDPLKGEPTDAQASQPLKGEPNREGAAPIRNPKSEIRNSFWAGVFDEDGDAPAAIEELYHRAIGLHKRESLVHAQMGVAARAGKRKEAYELAREIMEEVRPALDGIYDAVREWQKSGQLAVRQLAVGSQEPGVMELMKRLKYCNERVCRINAWLEDGARDKVVRGEKVKVMLTAVEIQGLDGERLDRMVEAKTIKEKLGI